MEGGKHAALPTLHANTCRRGWPSAVGSEMRMTPTPGSLNPGFESRRQQRTWSNNKNNNRSPTWFRKAGRQPNDANSSESVAVTSAAPPGYTLDLERVDATPRHATGWLPRTSQGSRRGSARRPQLVPKVACTTLSKDGVLNWRRQVLSHILSILSIFRRKWLPIEPACENAAKLWQDFFRSGWNEFLRLVTERGGCGPQSRASVPLPRGSLQPNSRREAK